MKLTILSLLLAAGGWYTLDARGPSADHPGDCEVTVQCIDEFTCLVTCLDGDGAVVCEAKIECDTPCDTPCDAACDATSAERGSSSACAPSGACAR